MKKINKYFGPLVFLVFLFTVILSFAGYEVSGALLFLNAFMILGFFIFYTVTENLSLYVLKRIGQTVFVMWVIASLTFILLRIIPGGPFDQEKALAPAVKAAIEAKYNLRAPLHTQYFNFIGGILKGDLGSSYKYLGREVSEIVAESFPTSFQLGIFALLVSYLIGIPAGVFAAAHHNTWKDSTTMILAISSVSLPSFLVATLAITFFSFGLNILPVALWDGPSYFIMPMVVLGLRPAAIIARLTRACVLEVIRSDYIRTARAKGLSERTILFKHVLKNSLIPVLTYSGPLAAEVLSGAFIIELIYNIPGMGKHIILSVTNRDYPLVLGITLIFSFMLVISNLIVDILYTYFDPRIKLS
jgi:oligopeptide transport system permease protein